MPSTSKTVATIVAVRPTVTAATYKVSKEAKGNLIEITGTNFRDDASQLTVTFNPALAGATVEACTSHPLDIHYGVHNAYLLTVALSR